MSTPKDVRFTRAHLEVLENLFPERTNLKTTEELFTQQGIRRVVLFVRDLVKAHESRVQTKEL